MSRPNTPKTEYDHLLKILLIGPEGTGKSSITSVFVTKPFTSTYEATLGIDFEAIMIDLDNQKIKLQIWDIAGQECYRLITKAYYGCAHGILLVVDLKHIPDLFDKSKKYHEFIENARKLAPEAQLHIVVNKTDMADHQSYPDLATANDVLITWLQSQKLDDTPIHYCSAKTGEGIEKAFTELTQSALDAIVPAAPAAQAAASVAALQPGSRLDHISTATVAIDHFKDLFKDHNNADARQAQKKQAIADLQYMVTPNFNGDAGEKILLEIYDALKKAAKGKGQDALANIARESAWWRANTFGPTGTYQALSDLIATELARREFNKYKTSINRGTGFSTTNEKQKIFSRKHSRGFGLFGRSPAANYLLDEIVKLGEKQQQASAKQLFLGS